MAKSVGVHEAKTTLSRLLDDVVAGEDVVILRRGIPVARLVPADHTGRRAFGIDRGAFVVAEDFDAPLSEPELDAFGA